MATYWVTEFFGNVSEQIIAGLVVIGVPTVFLVVKRKIAHRRFAVSSDKKIRVLIAQLDGDISTDGVGQTVYECIRRDLGDGVTLVRLSEALALSDGMDELAEARTLKRAHGLLKNSACDLLISGRLRSNNVISLKFIAAQENNEQEQPQAMTYVLTPEALDLPGTFISDLGVSIAAYVASTVKTVTRSKTYMVPTLRTLDNRLKAILSNPEAKFDLATIATLHHSYGLVKSRLYDLVGDLGDLRASIALGREALSIRKRESFPSEWATSQNSLGTCLARLGQATGEVRYFDEAILTLKAALQERTLEKSLISWAGTQSNLGGVFANLGALEDSITNLQESDRIYQEIITDKLRSADPELWAVAQGNRGVALLKLAEGTKDIQALNRSLHAFAEALEIRTKERAPFDWADTKSNVGTALVIMGDIQGEIHPYQEAVGVLLDALRVITRARTPKKWATVRSNLGSALTNVGAELGDINSLHDALSSLNGALEVFSEREDRIAWLVTKHNLGRAQMALGDIQSSGKLIREAIETIGISLNGMPLATLPWMNGKNSLGYAYLKLGELEENQDYLAEAQNQFEHLLGNLTAASMPLVWARCMTNRGELKRVLGQLQHSSPMVMSAVEDFEKSLRVISFESNRVRWSLTHFQLAKAYLAIAELLGGKRYLALAREECSKSLQGFANELGSKLVRDIGEMLARIDDLEDQC